MKRIVKIEGVGSVGFPDSMSDAAVSQVAGRLYDDANPTPNVPHAINDLKKSSDDTSDWRHIGTSDGRRWKIHPEDLEEAQRRDPDLQVIDQPMQNQPWTRVQFANGETHEIHVDDVDKALQRNPGAKILSESQEPVAA